MNETNNPQVFQFDLITRHPVYKRMERVCRRRGLLKDVVDHSMIDPAQPVKEKDYIHMVQKSDLWLQRRKQSDGTASSIGKFLLHPNHPFPRKPQVIETWLDKLNNVPFPMTETIRGHMKWGVVNEDVAATHFAYEQQKCVVQVGCIKLNGLQVQQSLKDYFLSKSSTSGMYRSWMNSFSFKHRKDLPFLWHRHFLISPDGVVGKPSNTTTYYSHPEKLLGMLEIKCVSPFHHIPEPNGTLSWTCDMMKRHWKTVGDIPFVYLVQMGLQALAGIWYYSTQMNERSHMWFIRWSPYQMDTFTFRFRHMIHLGLSALMTYWIFLDVKERCYSETTDETYNQELLVEEYVNELEWVKDTYTNDPMIQPDIFYQKSQQRINEHKYSYWTAKDIHSIHLFYMLCCLSFTKIEDKHQHTTTTYTQYSTFDSYRNDTYYSSFVVHDK